ncbi:MAG: putative toxin-antitoxin system toxin component, PIN family [Pyrinomonadaceae bacterium]|nr:putative toxin-antitoxin system toxin component, PIN family [Pyrinomonadaceae bacterium]MBP6213566.1 putative toxin-antitoxin system toxin component, PIN family [Pyrinomonadaceae bacterium]
MIRVILDTNLWISFLISKRLGKIDELFERDDLVLVFSEELLEEFLEVANRPKFRTYFPDDTVDELMTLFEEIGVVVDVTSDVDLCRDPKDNFLLALAKDGNADFLVTGDADLLVIGKFENTEILTYSAFEETIDSPAA